MPPLSKKRRYAKSAMSLVGRDISTGLFRSLKASALIVIEDDEIENELCTYDIREAQLHDLSDNSSGDVFNHCLRFMAGYRVGLTGAVLVYGVEKYESHKRLSASINLATLDEEYKTKRRNR